jgi:hypothetical protein
MEAVLGEVSGSAHQPRRDKSEAPQLVIDPDDVTLTPSKIIVKHTGDGGYFCMGFGPSAEFLRAVDEDRRFGAAIDDAEAALRKRGAPFASNRDPFLRRLGAAVALAKDGFDPNQPRDDHGRWTGDGGGEGAAAAFFRNRNSVVALPRLVPALRQLAEWLLSRLPGTAGGAVAFFGTLFIPTNRSLISEGTVPDAPDLGYYYDRDGGDLILTRTNGDGSKDVLFSGKPGPDDVFRDKNGNVVARFLDGSVVVDTSAVPGYRARSSAQVHTDDDEDASPQPNIPAANDNGPKLCPDPSLDRPRGELDPNKDDALYQAFIGEYVNGFALPTGFGISLLNPTTGRTVVFDNCQITTGIMIEAKSTGYLQMLQRWRERGGIYPWKNAERDMLDQSERQLEAAGGRPIEWHFAEKEVADYVRALFAKERPGITVIYTPPPAGLLSKGWETIASSVGARSVSHR